MITSLISFQCSCLRLLNHLLAGIHIYFYTTILLASFGCVIITYRVCLTQTFYRLDLRITYTAAQLDQLGLQVLRVAELSPLVADGYTDQGGHIVTQRLLADAIPGSYYVSLNQGHANLATALLEPDTPYSSYAQGTQLDLSHVLRVVTPAPLVFEDDE